jgi:peptidoglycan/xylan/chitin deacetylase (PgdA/CDA1 family)
MERMTARIYVTPSFAQKIALIALLLGVAPAAFAAGPSGAIIPHRTLWPDSINSAAEFDRASRAEILVFTHELAESSKLDEDALKDQLGIDAVDMPSIERLRRKLWKLLTENYVIAAGGCVAQEAFCPADLDPNNLQHEAEVFSDTRIQPRYKSWFGDAVRFHRTYLDELLRLAAVFPHRNSEVETFNDNELPGWEMHDRQFLLSFDDGPTRGPTRRQPNAAYTDRTLDMLRDNQVNAVFFVIGQSFRARLRDSSIEAMKALYSGMCVGSHGWLHKSHATWPQWKESVASSSTLIHKMLADTYVPAFRPPYGQRMPDSGPYLLGRGLKLILWNIDSHDWDDGLTADDVEQRVMSLMLLWRRGFILFHDFYPRARMVVPRLISWLAHDGVEWVDCHKINWSDANNKGADAGLIGSSHLWLKPANAD